MKMIHDFFLIAAICGSVVNSALAADGAWTSSVSFCATNNVLDYVSADDSRTSQPVVVTSYGVRHQPDETTVYELRTFQVGDGQCRAVALPVKKTVANARSSAPTRLRLEGSADGTTWRTLDERASVDWSVGSAGDTREYSINPARRGDCRHYRLTGTDSATVPAGLAQVELRGVLDCFTLPVDFKDKGGETTDVIIPRGWIVEHLGDAITGKTDDEIREQLNEMQPNGLATWQNEAIGWTGQEPAVNDITADPTTNRMKVSSFGEAMKITCSIPGVRAMFVLKKLIHTDQGGAKAYGDDLANDTWEEIAGKVSDTAVFEVDLEPGDPTGLYRIFLRFATE